MIKVKEFVKFEETNEEYITCGMGVDVNQVLLPLNTSKTEIEKWKTAGYQYFGEILIDENDFTLYKGEYILNEQLEEVKAWNDYGMLV